MNYFTLTLTKVVEYTKFTHRSLTFFCVCASKARTQIQQFQQVERMEHDHAASLSKDCYCYP